MMTIRTLRGSLSRAPGRAVLTAALTLLLAGCQSAPVKPPAEQIDSLLTACSATFDYQPDAVEAGLGPHDLAPREREWRQCVYQSVEREMLPSVLLADRLRELVAGDRAMTDEIAAGTLTRDARREQNLARLDAFFRDEKAARQEQLARMQTTMEQDARRMRELNRSELALRRSFTPIRRP